MTYGHELTANQIAILKQAAGMIAKPDYTHPVFYTDRRVLRDFGYIANVMEGDQPTCQATVAGITWLNRNGYLTRNFNVPKEAPAKPTLGTSYVLTDRLHSIIQKVRGYGENKSDMDIDTLTELHAALNDAKVSDVPASPLTPTGEAELEWHLNRTAPKQRPFNFETALTLMTHDPAPWVARLSDPNVKYCFDGAEGCNFWRFDIEQDEGRSNHEFDTGDLLATDWVLVR